MNASQFLEKLQQLDNQKLSDIKGLGPILIQNLQGFLNSNRYELLLKEFQALESRGIELNIQTEAVKSGQQPLSGEKICITGSFAFSRDKIKEMLEDLGAEVVSSVSKNTTILLAGEEAGSKLAKAQDLGIRIENDLSKLGL